MNNGNNNKKTEDHKRTSKCCVFKTWDERVAKEGLTLEGEVLELSKYFNLRTVTNWLNRSDSRRVTVSEVQRILKNQETS